MYMYIDFVHLYITRVHRIEIETFPVHYSAAFPNKRVEFTTTTQSNGEFQRWLTAVDFA